ncbi:MAG: general secretion pathway protein GspK [Novosphingobium sp.]
MIRANIRTQAQIPRGERGYAMVAAVAGIALMATIAASLATLASSRIDTLQAETTRAQLADAADAGVLLGLAGLTDTGPNSRWTIGGEVHELTFEGTALRVHIEDEHGKFLLNQANDETLTGLLSTLGYSSPQLDQLRASYLRWTGESDDTPQADADYAYYEVRGLLPRNTTPLTIDELGEIPGFTPELVARLRRIVTVEPGNVPFDPQFAQPEVLQAFTASGIESPEIIERRRELAGQRTALSFKTKDLKMRTVTVVSVAAGANGATMTKRTVARITGSPREPWIILHSE